MKKIKLSILAIIAICSVQSAMAWGTVGHLCAAYIAEQHLTPEAKAKCRHYLKHTLPYYAMWMDHWRGTKQFEAINNGHSLKTTKDGRKISWESFASGTMGTNISTPPGRAMGHLYNAFNELSDGKYKNLSDSVVRQRLINMIHYVGDMHCPCHSKFSKKYFPQYKGKKTAYRGKKEVAYHGFWDGSPGRWRKGWDIEDYAKNVDKVSKKQATAWQSGTFTDWGRDIAKGGHRGFALYPEGKDIDNLSSKERKAILALADEMAMQGAYRLAHVLNTIFADKSIETR